MPRVELWAEQECELSAQRNDIITNNVTITKIFYHIHDHESLELYSIVLAS